MGYQSLHKKKITTAAVDRIALPIRCNDGLAPAEGWSAEARFGGENAKSPLHYFAEHQ
jgi:hypothetical protein